MSDITYLGRKVRAFDSSPEFDGYTRVVITVSEDVEYTAGVETGRTLFLECPWGTQVMASNLLASIKGFQYQPYTATDALLDPAAELGDAITVNNVYSGIYTRETKFDAMCRATVSAPSEEELNHEYPYVSKQARKVTRKLYNLSTELKVQAGLISAEVSERKNDVASLQSTLKIQSNQISAEVSERKSETESLKSSLKIQADQISAEVETRKTETESLRSSLNIQAGEISAKVSRTSGDYATFGWNLLPVGWEIVSGYRRIFYVSKDGAEVNGKITATSGEIGGFTINANSLSYNNQTWGGTNTTGIYIGPSGIQLGKNFKVDSAGNLSAASGTFFGYVKAGNIQYGGDDGYFSGSGISAGSIDGGSGGKLAGSTLSTYNLTGGVNTSLGYADWAYIALNGWNKIPLISANSIVTRSLEVNNRSVSWKTKSFVDGDGNTVYINYLGG